MQTQPLVTHSLGSRAAFLNAALGAAALVVAVGLIGPAALTDQAQLVELARHNPTPLFIQDGLKVASAIVAGILVAVLFKQLRAAAPTRLGWATLFGGLAIVCLAANAGLSLYATAQAANSAQGEAGSAQMLAGLIGGLGLATIALNGGWYLLVGWSGLQTQRLPRWLSYLGLVIGGLSLVPPLAFLVLVLSVGWSVGLGQALSRR